MVLLDVWVSVSELVLGNELVAVIGLAVVKAGLPFFGNSVFPVEGLL
jgi:hypothetical protein